MLSERETQQQLNILARSNTVEQFKEIARASNLSHGELLNRLLTADRFVHDYVMPGELRRERIDNI